MKNKKIITEMIIFFLFMMFTTFSLIRLSVDLHLLSGATWITIVSFIFVMIMSLIGYYNILKWMEKK